MSKKRNDKESKTLLNAETKPKFLCLHYRKTFLQKKSFLRKRGIGGLNKKQKEAFLTALATRIKNDPTTSIRKPANEVKTVKTAMKQDLRPDP